MTRQPETERATKYAPRERSRFRGTRTERSFAVVSVALVAAACSPGPLPVSRSVHDPSSPLAPEGVPALANLAERASPVENTEHVAHSAATHSPAAHSAAAPDASSPAADEGASDLAYTCPMHPEVRSSEPGACPKCHMKLVPKKH